MRIIHICPDEKFIDAVWETFESLEPGKNRYLVLGDDRELRYISKARVEFIGKQPWNNQKLYIQLREASCVILHSLNIEHIRLINSRYMEDVNFVWLGFGYDYYDYIAGSVSGLCLSRTAALVRSSKQGVIQWLSKCAKKAKLRGVLVRYLKRKAIKRINFFSPVLEVEYDLVKAAFFSSTNFPKVARYNYGVNAKFFDALGCQEAVIPGPNILLGNSANPTNNHIEAIELLADLELGGRLVITPLSYGYRDRSYIEKVCKYGRQKLGDNFKPLVGFLPYQEYVDLLSSCGFVLMNHKRQQALGNIQMQVARGATVFLRKENPIYSWYEEIGVIVCDIDSISSCRGIVDLALDLVVCDMNRRIVVENFGWNAHLNRTRKFIEQVTYPLLSKPTF